MALRRPPVGSVVTHATGSTAAALARRACLLNPTAPGGPLAALCGAPAAKAAGAGGEAVDMVTKRTRRPEAAQRPAVAVGTRKKR